jgi:hypothetical protein
LLSIVLALSIASPCRLSSAGFSAQMNDEPRGT